MSTTLFTLPSDYSYVIGSTCVAAMVLHLSGLIVDISRWWYFSPDKITDFQVLLHSPKDGDLETEIGEVPTHGYPDDGQGRIAKSFSYGDWYRFNRLNRGYLNYTEQIVLFIVSILVCGLSWPQGALWSGLLIALSRLTYFVGYAFFTNSLIMGMGELGAFIGLFFNFGVFFTYLAKH